jgi:glutaredoxin/ATP-dependent protease HslVU (ClpYQ) peptidase subunit
LPAALLFTTPGCPHCPGVKRALAGLLEEGTIAALEVVDATVATERAQALGVRGVPWLRLGLFEFEGQMTPAELRRWAEVAARPDGLRTYCFEMLKSGQRAKVERLLREEPSRSVALAQLVTDPEAGMAVRLGIGAVLEELQGSGATEPMARPLAQALASAAPRDRADIAHFLSLIGGETAQAALRACLDDSDPEVREIAQEALAPPA